MNGSCPSPSILKHPKQKLAFASLLLLGLLLLGRQPLRAETRWQDIPDDFWAKSAIHRLNERGILIGGADRFYPYRPITRAEYASILAKALPQKAITTAPQRFSDIPKHHWAAQAIQTVVGQGWMSGVTRQQFRPNQILTLGELYTSLGKIQPSTLEADQAASILSPYRDQDQLPEWARVPVAQAVASGLILSERSKTRLSPNLPASRASVAVCVDKALQGMTQASTAPMVAAGFQALSQARREGLPASLAPNPALIESVPAVNVVGQLAPGETSGSWQLVRADGKRFTLDAQAVDARSWQAGQSVQVTGNLDALRGTTNDPILVVQTCHPIEPFAPDKAASLETEALGSPKVISSTVSPTTLATDNVTPSASPEKGSENLSKAEAKPSVLPDNASKEQADLTSASSESASVSHKPMKRERLSGPSEFKLYFPNLANLLSDPSLMLGEAIARPGLAGSSPQQAVEAILGGPIDSEKRAGYFMDADLKRLRLDKFSLNESGLATVQLYAPGDFQFSNSSVPARLDEQIRRTLKQFDGVHRVKVSVKNPKDKILWISP
jgi:hypothetical protein